MSKDPQTSLKIPKINPKNPNVIPAPNFSSENQPEGRGRPKGSVSIVRHLKKLLEENNQAQAKACGKSLVKNFKKGNPVVIKEVLGRIDGVLIEKMEVDHGLKGLSDAQLEAMIGDLFKPKSPDKG